MTPLRKATSQFFENERRIAGTCARIAWLSGRGVPWSAACSMYPRSSGSVSFSTG